LAFALEKGKDFINLIWAILMFGSLDYQQLLNSREGRAIRALKGGQ